MFIPIPVDAPSSSFSPYEGVDHRVEEHLADELISIGDYVLTGGELGAMVISGVIIRSAISRWLSMGWIMK